MGDNVRNHVVTAAEAGVLARVGSELASAAASIKSLQGSLGPVLGAAGTLRPELIHDLQDLDHVEQVLASLAALVTGLAPAPEASPPREPLDALLDRIPLAALAQRLRGALRPPPSLAPVGDVDLF